MSIDIEIPRYTIIRELGSGGMAVVYLATQEGLDRPVAVKVLRKSLSTGKEEFKKRFEHEGRMLAQLEHENIVKIFDIGATENTVYMVMEYLRGGTLSQKMREGDLTVADIIKICAQIGLALQTAHQKNIIHRDLKPSNIMFRDAVTPVLTDFGIARKIDQDMTLTATGMMIGTPQYMSPEQIQGKPVDARSDIYSLGLMFYKLITGDLPFAATDPIALAMQQIQEPPPPLPGELVELQPVMDLMLAKNPSERYQSMLDFCNHLRSISLTGEDYSAELTAATRIFSSAQLKSFDSLTGERAEKHPTTESSAVSRAFSSISTAVSTVLTQRKPRNVLLATILALAVGGFLASQFFSHGLSESEVQKIERELTRFNAYVDLDQITSPPDKNAVESLKKMLAIAPDYGEVEEAADRLADIFLEYAYEAYDSDQLDPALEEVTKGLALAPEHGDLVELREILENRIAERDRLLRIEQLLAAGSQALEQQNLLPPAAGNAFEVFDEVRSLDLQNELAEAGMSQIQKQVELQVRQAWEIDGRESARQLTLQGLEYFPDSTLLMTLQSEIEREEVREREQAELENLLAQAQQQFIEGKLVEPPGANALESYRKAQDLRSENTAARQGLERIAAYYLATAQTLFVDGAYQESLDAIRLGLKAVSDHPGLLAAQNEANAQLDARDLEIRTRLQQADRMVAAQQYIPGQPGMETGAQNAADSFNSLLELDPGNVAATAGLAALQGQLDTAAGQMQRDGKLDEARALLMSAQDYYGDAAYYASRLAILDQKIAERAAKERMARDLAAIDSLIDSRPLTSELVERTAAALREVSVEFSNEVAVSERLSRFITVLGDEADITSRGGNDDAALALLENALLLYPGNTRLSRTRTQVLQRQADRVEQERQRIAAMSGVLAIDAMPWGRVLQIHNSDQVLQDLPVPAETPLFLTLVEGAYVVTVAAADGGSTIEVPVEVKRQEVVTARADLQLINADDYFEKSGW